MESDEEIVGLIQKGESEKFGEIIRRYQGKLKTYVGGLINQEEMEVEDVVEDSLIAAYENLNEFDRSKKFSSWLYRIAHNKAIDYFKKKRIKGREMGEEEEWLENKDKLIEELEIEKERREKIRQAIEKLEWKYREVIILYYFEDKNYEEISDILHISINKAGVWLYRAREKLKESLEY